MPRKYLITENEFESIRVEGRDLVATRDNGTPVNFGQVVPDISPEMQQLLDDTVTARDQAEVFAAGTVELQDEAIAQAINTPGSDTQTQLNATIESAVVGSPATLTPLPGYLNNEWRYQQSSYSQDNIVTVDSIGMQYAVWIDDQIHPVVGKRAIGSQTWDETYDLRNIAGDPFGVQAADGHNTFVIGVDPAGLIHVSGNMHGDALRYARTTTAGDITAWITPGMVGTDEGGVTYPQFFNAANGDLFFIYRNGGSGNGDTVLNRRVGGQWQRVAILINGIVTNQNAYTNRVGVGPDGSIHLMFMWRDEGQASTNADICYTYSDDGGATWKRTNGSAQTVPITRENAEVVVNVEHESGIVNQSGMDVDRDGNPHGAFMMYDGAGNTQYFHTWYDGATWHHDQVTDFTTRVETLEVFTLELTTARPQIICTATGRTYIIGMTQGDGWGGAAILVDVTPGAGNPIAKLFDMDLKRWEPSYDQRALKERGELNVLVTPYLSPAPAGSQYTKQRGWILSTPAESLTRFFGIGFTPPSGTDALRRSGDLASGESIGRVADRGSVPSSGNLDDYYLPDQQGLYLLEGPGRVIYNLPIGVKVPGLDATAQSAWVRLETFAPSYSVQTVFSTDGGYVYQRVRQAGAWGSWRQIAGDNGNVLATDTDLFTLENGSYQLSSSGTYPNEPSAFASLGVAGTLNITGYGSAIRVAQLVTLDRSTVWENWSVSGTWQTWRIVRGPSTSPLTEGTDLATLGHGDYLLSSGAVAYTNEPVEFAALNVAGVLEVKQLATGVRFYRLTTFDRTESWEATYSSSSLSAWAQTRGG